MTGTVNPNRDVNEDEVKALVTIETVERLTAKASEALEAGDLDRVRALFGAIVDETTTRTCTAVKRQALSDHIAGVARTRVRHAVTRAEVYLQDMARAAEAEHDAQVERSIAEHEADLASRLDV